MEQWHGGRDSSLGQVPVESLIERIHLGDGLVFDLIGLLAHLVEDILHVLDARIDRLHDHDDHDDAKDYATGKKADA